jgi:hypothetical protein
VAPTDIKDDVDTVSEVSRRINQLLIDAGGDQSEVDQDALELILNEAFTDEFNAAGGRIDGWAETNCT